MGMVKVFKAIEENFYLLWFEFVYKEIFVFDVILIIMLFIKRDIYNWSEDYLGVNPLISLF